MIFGRWTRPPRPPYSESLEYWVFDRLSRLMSEERHHRLSAQQLRSSSLLDTFLPSTTARDSLPSSILPRSVTSVTLHEKWCRLWLWIDDIKVEMWINSVHEYHELIWIVDKFIEFIISFPMNCLHMIVGRSWAHALLSAIGIPLAWWPSKTKRSSGNRKIVGWSGRKWWIKQLNIY